ncbi:unnamed protein product, partial [Ectocarpus sp. 12 AP-2014]
RSVRGGGDGGRRISSGRFRGGADAFGRKAKGRGGRNDRSRGRRPDAVVRGVGCLAANPDHRCCGRGNRCRARVRLPLPPPSPPPPRPEKKT